MPTLTSNKPAPSNSPTDNHLCTVTLLGNLVSKPEVRYQANPVIAIAECTIATHKKWFDKVSNQYKEWTTFHTVRVVGDAVEQSILPCQKGDVIYLQGYLVNCNRGAREIVHATFAQVYSKGYAQSINQIHCSGVISEAISLVTTEQNILLAEIPLTIHHTTPSVVNQALQQHSISRIIHVWGKQAQYLQQHAHQGDTLVVDGRLSYVKNTSKTQLIDASQVTLLKNSLAEVSPEISA